MKCRSSPSLSDRNMALRQPATQSSLSQWSKRPHESASSIHWPHVVKQTLQGGHLLADRLKTMGVETQEASKRLQAIDNGVTALDVGASDDQWQSHYFAARRMIRRLSLANPLLDFRDLLFVKRAPSMFPHLSDQYYGWWARPGGGVFVLRDWKTSQPDIRLSYQDPGRRATSFVPMSSYDGKRPLCLQRIFLACCRHQEQTRQEQLCRKASSITCMNSICRRETHRALTRGKVRRL